jgi:hypothetical protein
MIENIVRMGEPIEKTNNLEAARILYRRQATCQIS